MASGERIFAANSRAVPGHGLKIVALSAEIEVLSKFSAIDARRSVVWPRFGVRDRWTGIRTRRIGHLSL
ncbi:MAG TPA: hypothetical protein VMU99_02200 [Acidimicrobiales bacterium]|nr:hypothetical protein [Acidimicrobiales bacterium]